MKCPECNAGKIGEVTCVRCKGSAILDAETNPPIKEATDSEKALVSSPLATERHSGVEKSDNFEPLAPGIHVYLGTTGVGKTHKAWEECLATHKATGRNVLVIDSGGAENFRQFPHAKDLRDCITQAWSSSPTIVFYTPSTEEDFERIMAAAKTPGGIILFIDEVSFWATSTGFKMLCRLWRHSNVTILVTCQHVGTDLGQALLACSPTLYIFRVTAPRSLEWVERYHQVSEEEVRALPDRSFITRRF